LFAGLEECLKFIRDYRFHPTDIEYLRGSLPTYIESEFFDYLSTLTMDDVTVYAVPEGKPVFAARLEHEHVRRSSRFGSVPASTSHANRGARAQNATARNNTVDAG
jgi:hypothetical protein